MLTHIHDIHTEDTLTLVNKKSTSLENSLSSLILIIEIVECHEVSYETEEITEDVEIEEDSLDGGEDCEDGLDL
jgi:hypothetical protein